MYNVKASTGKPKSDSNHNVGDFHPKLTLTTTWGDFHPNSHQPKCGVIFTWTYTNHNVGWFSLKLTLTITWCDLHPNSQSTITWGDFHLGTTWPALLSVWKSPEVSIPGVCNLCRKLECDQCKQVIHFVGEPRFVASFTWTSFCSALMVDRFHSVLPQVYAQGASLFWLSQSSRNFS